MDPSTDASGGGSSCSTSSSGEVPPAMGRAVLEICLPFTLAGLGMVLAGKLLDHVQFWPVFQECPELFILVPALLGLKGNLEMTLASRLSTWTNLQLLTSSKNNGRSTVLPMSLYGPVALGNLALVQVQAVSVGFLAAVFALLVGWGPQGKFDLAGLVLVTSSSVVTASVASFILGVVMVFLIYWSGRFNVNPDNVATPIAASLGDLVTLAILSGVATSMRSLKSGQGGGDISEGGLLEEEDHFRGFLAHFASNPVGAMLDPMNRMIVVPYFILAAYVGVIAPASFQIASRCKETETILYSGWTPVLIAMVISSLGGQILNRTISLFPEIASYQPVINGVAGNLVSVQASRISTELHRTAEEPNCANVDEDGGRHHRRIETLLLGIVVPGHLFFNSVIRLINGSSVDPLDAAQTPFSGSLANSSNGGFVFLILYLGAALIQVGLLLKLSGILVQWLWRSGIDPDSAAIPYLTALGDLLGGALLAGAFHLDQVLQ